MPSKKNQEKKKDAKPKVTKQMENAGKGGKKKKEAMKAKRAAAREKANTK